MSAKARTSNLADLVNRRIQELRGRKLQREIAREAGYTSPNMITMLKQGQAKVALDKVPALAKALEVDPALLLRLTMEQFYDQKTVAMLLGICSGLTPEERQIVELMREPTSGGEPAVERVRSALAS